MINNQNLTPHSGINAVGDTLSPTRLSAVARGMYSEGPFLLRKLQHWRPFICPFERLIGHVPNGARVLDIGCGAGLLLSLIAGLGVEFEGIGVDVSSQAIDLAKNMASRLAANSLKARLSFEQVAIESGWPVGAFDVVFLVDVLHHVHPNNQEIFVGRAIATVKPGGVLVFKDMCCAPWWKAQANRLHDLMLAHEVIHYVPIETVEKWAMSKGMEIFLREDPHRLWYGHELRVMRQSFDQERIGSGG